MVSIFINIRGSHNNVCGYIFSTFFWLFNKCNIEKKKPIYISKYVLALARNLYYRLECYDGGLLIKRK